MRITFKSELQRLKKDKTKLQRDVINKSVYLALNKTIPKVRTETSRLVRQEANLKHSYITRKLDIKLTASSPQVSINTVRAKATNLIEYVRGDVTRFRRRTKSGRFTAAARKGVSAKPYERVKTYKGAFIGKGRNSGKSLVFKRTGVGRRSRLEPVYGPSIRRMFIRPEFQSKLTVKAQKEFPIELQRAIRQTMRQNRLVWR